MSPAGSGASSAEPVLLQALWTSPLPASLHRPDGCLVDVNEAFAARVGRSRDALVGIRLHALLPAGLEPLSAAAGPVHSRLTSLEALASNGGRTVVELAQASGPPLTLTLWHAWEPSQESGASARQMAAERDLARLELGVLMDTAGVGVATYDSQYGWLHPPAPPNTATRKRGPSRTLKEAPAASALQGIRRDLVEPASRPAYDQLQQALRRGESAEVRYAVRHPELGQRWLLTRVEPTDWAGGRRTSSVVTLDVTEQVQAQRRSEQLLHELSTILESSTAGIASVRAGRLVRCNQRFEQMLGCAPGGAAGEDVRRLFEQSFAGREGLPAGVHHALEALAAGHPFEAELPLGGGDGGPSWVSLSVRPVREDRELPEAVAVLTDITRLKAQQVELQRLLRDRESMFNLSEVGLIHQRGARVERANHAMALLSGWSGTELGTLDVAELYADARECVAFEAEIARALHDHGRYSGERQLRRRDGSLTWVQVGVRPVDRHEPAQGLICSFVDIDERQRAREALALQAERTRAVLDSVLVGIVTVSAGGIQWLNRSARRMFGGELSDFIGASLATVATPEPDHPLRRTDWMLRLQQGQTVTFECRLRGRDGREFWVVGNVVPSAMPADSGEPELTIALLDIEQRRQAEVRIARAQASLQQVIETAPLAIALIDASTLRVQQANQTAATFFGVAPEVLGSASLLDASLTAAGPARQLAQWLHADDPAGPLQEWRDTACDPARVWDCRLTRLDDGVSAAALWLLVASEVTEQRAAEHARLQAAIAQREVLVREVHHRIKNNLQGVAGLLQQNAARQPELAEALQEAVSQVQAIAQVYGLQVGASGPMSVLSLVKAIAQSLQRTFGRMVAVESDEPLAHLLPEAEAIPIALTVNELMTNAIKHGRSGVVTCRLQPRGDAVVLSIASAGRLPPDFDLGRVRGGVSGLGLVRALLPRRSARFALRQDGEQVVAEVELQPPSVCQPDPLHAGPAPTSA